jgi:hypothetical protein
MLLRSHGDDTCHSGIG